MMELTRRRLWFAVFVLVVFTSGLAAGIAIDRYAGGRRAPAFGGGRPDFGPGARGGPGRRPPRPTEIVDRLSRDLDLSADQRAKLEEIFKRGAERMEKFQEGTRHQFQNLRRQLDAEIVTILSPEQRKKFEEQARRRPRDPRPPPGL